MILMLIWDLCSSRIFFIVICICVSLVFFAIVFEFLRWCIYVCVYLQISHGAWELALQCVERHDVKGNPPWSWDERVRDMRNGMESFRNTIYICHLPRIVRKKFCLLGPLPTGCLKKNFLLWKLAVANITADNEKIHNELLQIQLK